MGLEETAAELAASGWEPGQRAPGITSPAPMPTPVGRAQDPPQSQPTQSQSTAPARRAHAADVVNALMSKPEYLDVNAPGHAEVAARIAARFIPSPRRP